MISILKIKQYSLNILKINLKIINLKFYHYKFSHFCLLFLKHWKLKNKPTQKSINPKKGGKYSGIFRGHNTYFSSTWSIKYRLQLISNHSQKQKTAIRLKAGISGFSFLRHCIHTCHHPPFNIQYHRQIQQLSQNRIIPRQERQNVPISVKPGQA